MDAFRTMAIKAAANQNDLVRRFGRVHRLQIDTEQRVVEASVALLGEPETIEISFSYAIEPKDSRSQLTLSGLRISRAWLQQVADLAQEHKGPFRFPLEGIAGKILSLVL